MPITFTFFFATVAVLTIPVTLTGLTIILILFFLVMIFDGPILFSALLIGSIVMMIGIFVVLLSPFIFVITGIMIPFDKVFYVWFAIMIFVVLWEIILPIFGYGL